MDENTRQTFMGPVRKVDDLLYETTYRSYDYEAAERYFSANPPAS